MSIEILLERPEQLEQVVPAVLPPSDTGVKNAIQSDGSYGTSRKCVSVDFLTDCVRIKYPSGMTKLVTIKEFHKIFSETLSAVEEEEPGKVKGFKLPPNVFYFGHSKSSLELSMYYPGGVRDVNFCGESLPRLVPNILMSVGLVECPEGYKHSFTRYLCTDLDLKDLDRIFYKGKNHSKNIFILPFSNMYDDGSMCTGQNQLPKTFKDFDLRSVDWHFSMVWESPFNFDLGLRGLSSKSRFKSNISYWFQHLHELAINGTTKFPYEELEGWKPSR